MKTSRRRDDGRQLAWKHREPTLVPAPAVGSMLAVIIDRVLADEFLYMAKVDRVTPSGQFVIRKDGATRHFHPGGREVGGQPYATMRVRWPTESDRAEHRRKGLLETLRRYPWEKATGATLEQVAALLQVTVKDEV